MNIPQADDFMSGVDSSVSDVHDPSGLKLYILI